VRRSASDDGQIESVNPRRSNMQANRSRDTGPEMRVRRLLHHRGLRYFVHRRPVAELRNRADLVFPTPRVAVFIDGCYWHGCPEHYSSPKVNAEYWSPKIAGNKARDSKVDRALRDAGWTVIRAWEHEDPSDVADRIEEAVRSPA
jgi:DNA mismatch endonuclease (patch repair protein)